MGPRRRRTITVIFIDILLPELPQYFSNSKNYANYKTGTTQKTLWFVTFTFYLWVNNVFPSSRVAMNLPETTKRRGGITPPAASVVSLPLRLLFHIQFENFAWEPRLHFVCV